MPLTSLIFGVSLIIGVFFGMVGRVVNESCFGGNGGGWRFGLSFSFSLSLFSFISLVTLLSNYNDQSSIRIEIKKRRIL